MVDSDDVTVKSEKLKMFIKDYFDSNESRIERAFSDINNPNDENRTRYVNFPGLVSERHAYR